MGKARFTPKLLCVLVANLVFPVAYAQSTEASATDESLDTITVTADRLEERGSKLNIYTKNVANDYLTREEITRYRTDSAGDVLKSMVGVYNMNSRTAGASITPNIRGISGKGRIPFTIDGTEQTVDVWLNNYGVGERNYIDPALLRSIEVEKGPSLSRYMKPGIGGSVAARTIEADDIIPEGDSWGLQFKMEGSGNTVNPSGQDLGKYLGKDYRQFNATADGAGGGVDPLTGELSPFAVDLDGAFTPKARKRSDIFNFKNDMNYMIAGAYRNQFVDVLGAYSLREKGNYISGKRGAKGYLNNPIYDTSWSAYDECGEKCRSSNAFIPNMARMYKPGTEVLNSHTRAETKLFKNNWYLPHQQKISLEYMDMDVSFGEINPFTTTFVLNVVEHNQDLGAGAVPTQTPTIASHINSKTQKIGYEWKPEDNQWIDLSANLWRVVTHSKRHQSGGPSLAVAQPVVKYDAWYSCKYRHQVASIHASWAKSCNDLAAAFGFTTDMTREEVLKNSWFSNEDGKQNIISGALQKSKFTRTGFDISNRFKINDKLNLTLGFDFQREKLDEKNKIINSDDLFNITGMVTGLTNLAGPKAGKRQEWGVNLAANWQVTSRLTVDAGIRYSKFSAENTALKEGRKNRDPWSQFAAGARRYASGGMLMWGEIIQDPELRQIFKDMHSQDAEVAAKAEQALIDKEGVFWHKKILYVEGEHYRRNYQYLPFENGKLNLASADFKPGMAFEKMSMDGRDVYKYVIIDPKEYQGGKTYTYEELLNSTHPRMIHMVRDREDVIDEPDVPKGEADMVCDGGRYLGYCNVVSKIPEALRWAPPPKLKGSAWSPMLGLTYRLGDNHTLFARYATMSRFPSVYEVTGTQVTTLNRYPLFFDGQLKPERSRNIEIGWAFNFAPYIEGLRQGNVRLTYFDNKIKNVIDTTDDFRITQYDERKTKGIEFQSQFDAGKLFGSLGVTYRLEQKTCDAYSTMRMDVLRYRIPKCITGSFGSTRFFQAQQPKYSVVAELGTRLLDENLELGARAIYHSKVDSSEYNKMVRKGLDYIYVSTGKPYHWRSHLLVDVYGRYQVNKHLAINAGVTNLTNQYYLDPMSNVPAPGPGRTVTVGIQAQF